MWWVGRADEDRVRGSVAGVCGRGEGEVWRGRRRRRDHIRHTPGLRRRHPEHEERTRGRERGGEKEERESLSCSRYVKRC